MAWLTAPASSPIITSTLTGRLEGVHRSGDDLHAHRAYVGSERVSGGRQRWTGVM
jgi:hypothetical protein